MAVFNVVVKGTLTPALLIETASETNACMSTFTFSINATAGDNIQLTFTPSPPGYTNLRYLLDGKAITSGHSFTYSSQATLKVYLENSGAIETVSLQIDAENTTQTISSSKTVERDSVGAPC